MKIHLEDFFQAMYLEIDVELHFQGFDVVSAHVYDARADKKIPWNTMSGDLRREIINRLYKELKLLEIDV